MAKKPYFQLVLLLPTFFSGVAVGFYTSKDYWYKKGAEDVIIMYEDFGHGIERNEEGRGIDLSEDFDRVQKNRQLLKKINPYLE